MQLVHIDLPICNDGHIFLNLVNILFQPHYLNVHVHVVIMETNSNMILSRQSSSVLNVHRKYFLFQVKRKKLRAARDYNSRVWNIIRINTENQFIKRARFS